MQGLLEMTVNLRTKKQLISRVVGVGVHRIKLDSEHLDDIADAITRNNVQSLITAGRIKIKPVHGTSRGRAQLKRIQKKKRGIKTGSKKGKANARLHKKEKYMIKVRALRYRLKISKERKEITNKDFWMVYKKIQGNTIRNSAHLREIVSEIKNK